MGRVKYDGECKAFRGVCLDSNGNPIPDSNSIQEAVAGTLNNPNMATKNIVTLRNLSNLELFDPKRTTLAKDMVAFRGYPKPTVDVITSVAEFTDSNIALNFGIQINYKVGYTITDSDLDFPLQFSIYINGDTLNAVQPEINIPSGSTSQASTIINFSGDYGSTASITIESVNGEMYYYLIDFDSNGRRVINANRDSSSLATVNVVFTAEPTCTVSGGETTVQFLSFPENWTSEQLVSSEVNGGYNSAGNEGNLVYFIYQNNRYVIRKEERCLNDSGEEALEEEGGVCPVGTERRWRWIFQSRDSC